MLAKAYQVLRSALPLLAAIGAIRVGPADRGAELRSRISARLRRAPAHAWSTRTARSTNIDVAGGMGQVMDYGRYVPGGRLEVLDLRDGNVDNIIGGLPDGGRLERRRELRRDARSSSR